MQQATRVSDRTAFYSVLRDEKSELAPASSSSTGSTPRIFEDPQDSRTQATSPAAWGNSRGTAVPAR